MAYGHKDSCNHPGSSCTCDEEIIDQRIREIARIPFDDLMKYGDPYKILRLMERKIKELIDEVRELDANKNGGK